MFFTLQLSSSPRNVHIFHRHLSNHHGGIGGQAGRRVGQQHPRRCFGGSRCHASFRQRHPPKAEPVQDYLTDADTRRVLFDEFRATCQELDPLQFDPPHATMLAVFMVAPVSEIRTQLDVFRNMEQHRPQMVTAMLSRTPHAMRTCTFLVPRSSDSSLDTNRRRYSQTSFCQCARLSACLQAFNHSLRTGHVGCDEKQVCRSSTCHVYSLLPPSPRYLLTEARSWTEMGTLVCFLAHRTQRQRTFSPSRQAKRRLSGT